MARKAKLERIAAPKSEFATLTREALLLHADQRTAADEIYRRAFNKMVAKKNVEA